MVARLTAQARPPMDAGLHKVTMNRYFSACAASLLFSVSACKGRSPQAEPKVTAQRQPTDHPVPAAPEDEALVSPPGAAEALPEIRLEKVVEGLAAPTNLVTAPDGTLVVLDQGGMAYRIDAGTLIPFADLSDRVVDLKRIYDERGLLGMAFHPEYPKVRRVFVWYSAPLRKEAPRGYDHTNVLSTFEVNAQGRVDPKTERRLLALDWAAPNHDGGTVRFGPDRMLYVSMGDGGKSNDVGPDRPPMGHGQDWTTLMGSILRIDPNGGDPYGIPKDNPFVGDHEGADEIWAYGLRNPYAFSFDRADGTMYAGDVGQELLEEVNIIEAGKNYGWSVKEGTLCFNKDDPHKPGEGCENVGEHGEPLVDPILEYAQIDSALADRSQVHGVSVIGGYVYRGKDLPGLEGAYVFGDWSRKNDTAEGVLMVGRRSSDGWSLSRLPVQGISGPHIGHYIRAFGEDAQGELYMLTSDEKGTTGTTGIVWRLAPS